MKALVIDQSKGTLSLNEVKKPEITEQNDVLVKVRYVGICGTDVGMLDHKNKSGTICTLGHEITGLVEDFGEAVHDLKVGDPVCVSAGMVCGYCSFCTADKGNLCDNEGVSTLLGISIDGGMTDYIVVNRKRVFLLPPQLPLKIAALSDPLATVFHPFKLAVTSLDPEKSNALLIGCGWAGIGMSLLLHRKGFKKITVVQRSKPRRDALLGFDLGIRVIHPDALREEFKAKNGRIKGFDFIFDTVGNRESLKEYFPLTRKGGQFYVFGINTGDPSLCLDAVDPVEIIWHEISISGTIAYTPKELTKSIKELDEMHKSFDLSKIGINVYSIERYEEGFAALQNKTVVKAMFEFNAETN
ncbi:unnamed protein product [Owenia fusiformis]|uniref:Uncharacterized protein n=1 Tax=Owenia fusiformis TaxID=6347 RepID=A0A8J1TC03_OWEFU|nr:unnamed protein product [Owenia fusiformis]